MLNNVCIMFKCLFYAYLCEPELLLNSIAHDLDIICNLVIFQDKNDNRMSTNFGSICNNECNIILTYTCVS